jgi:hypothetical protein
MLLGFASYGQLDTIYKMDGELIPSEVKEISEKSIKFSYPNESLTNTLGKSSVIKIVFRSGREQVFASELNVAEVNGCLDWAKVQLSNIESEVSGLFKLANVGSKAKGMTVHASLAKLQERAYDKTKIATAMLGGNLAYIIDKNTEEAVMGRGSSGAKMPSVTISANSYTSRKVSKKMVQEGDYTVVAAYVLRTNEFTLNKYRFDEEIVKFNGSNLFEENGFAYLKKEFKNIKKVEKYKIIASKDGQIVLSGVYQTRTGRKTYYNIILKILA